MRWRALRELLKHAAAGLRPDPPLTVSQWAAAHRYLDSSTSARTGRWRNEVTPYMVEIMDALSPQDPCHTVVGQKAAQIAFSEACHNLIGYVIDCVPGPLMIVLPTWDLAKQWSRTRLQPMIETTPRVKSQMAASLGRAAGSAWRLKAFIGGLLVIGCANVANTLKSQPIRFLIEDEIDGYTHDSGGEGDPCALAEMRTTSFPTRKIFKFSTPKRTSTSRIRRAYLQSDKRLYYVPCCDCGHEQHLRWKQVQWPDNDPSAAEYVCEDCGSVWPETHKTWFLPRGRWVPIAESTCGCHHCGELRESPTTAGVKGYWINGLYRPLGWRGWGTIAAAWVNAKGDPEHLQTVVNLDLAECWDDTMVRSVNDEDLLLRVEDWGAAVPADVVLITAGVDTQDNRLEVEIKGWGIGEESWSLGYYVLMGDPSCPPARGVWADLTALLTQSFDHELVGQIWVSAVCIDSAGHNTLGVYRYAKLHEKRRKPRTWAIVGRGGQGKRVWPRRPSTNNKGKIALYAVGVDAIKESIMQRIERVTEPGPGYLHFGPHCTLEYFRQLRAEVGIVDKKKGAHVRRWVLRGGHRNEVLDCNVYAGAALQGWYALGRKLETELDRVTAGSRRSESSRPRRRPFLDRQRGFLGVRSK